jgi:hypothetical protein
VANDTSEPRRGPSDPTDYSSTKAPETQAEAEEKHAHPSDARLHPGGAHGAAADPGMSSLDDATVPDDPHKGPSRGQHERRD